MAMIATKNDCAEKYRGFRFANISLLKV